MLEVRKVQKLGYSTAVVSLPRSWVKERGIKKGDNVIIRIEEDGSLRIMPYNAIEEKSTIDKYTLNVTNISSEKFIERIIIGSYILGHDNLTIKTNEEKLPQHVVDEVMNAISKLAGIEIVEQKKNEITLQCFIDPTKFKLKGLVRRLYTLIFSMIEGISNFLSEGNESIFSQIDSIEAEADRLYWLLVRQLLLSQRSWRIAKEIGITHPYHVVGNRAIVKALENIADTFTEVCKILETIPREWLVRDKLAQESVLRKLSEIIERIGNLLSESMQAFIELSLERANEAINGAERYKEAIHAMDQWILEKVKDPYVLSSLRLILTNLTLVLNEVQVISEIIFNRSLEVPSSYYYWEVSKK